MSISDSNHYQQSQHGRFVQMNLWWYSLIKQPHLHDFFPTLYLPFHYHRSTSSPLCYSYTKTGLNNPMEFIRSQDKIPHPTTQTKEISRLVLLFHPNNTNHTLPQPPKRSQTLHPQPTHTSSHFKTRVILPLFCIRNLRFRLQIIEAY